jgi:3-deoxy-manno-octulosonate cytidylyltransferase (CMP-KDO synthetase)
MPKNLSPQKVFPHNVLVVIPARMASTRLPGKPLADLLGEPMIVQVWRRAIEAEIGPVLVAADGADIADAIRAAGGDALLTDPELPSGSDRIFAALRDYDPNGRFEVIVNLQGDLPTIDPASVRASLAPLEDEAVDIATLAAVIRREEEKTDPNVVKAVGSPLSANRLRALYFTRAAAPWGEGALFHHIGLYAYRRAALQRFVALPPSPLEKREKLEQLRALEAGMRIDVEIVDHVPLGVDTPHDLERARKILMGQTA